MPRKKPTLDPPTRRKNTIISLLCASDPLAPAMALSFVASPDSCTYIFEARTPAACGGVEVAQQQLGPAGVFGVIALVAVLVYLVGGCFYQRTVMHQRGWRQLPNYSLWAGIGGFFFVSHPSLLAAMVLSALYDTRCGLWRGSDKSADETRIYSSLPRARVRGSCRGEAGIAVLLMGIRLGIAGDGAGMILRMRIG